jgi:hypothetical protein
MTAVISRDVLQWMTLVSIAALVFFIGGLLGATGRPPRPGVLEEAVRIRLEAAEAERKMHDLTIQAIVAMAEEASKARTTK